jgi:hypothetical protein
LNYYNYFTEIEETFIRRRGKNLLLSPLDWALIESWQEREVPLHIVLRGIEKVFDLIDKQPARTRSIKSLFYCKEEIEAQFAEWLASQVGKNGSAEVPSSKFQVPGSNEVEQSSKSELFSAEAIENHLETATADLQSAKENAGGDLLETLERVLNRLSELKTAGLSAELLEESLEKLDTLIDESLLQNSDTGNLQKEIKKQLGSYQQKMERDVFNRTMELMLLKRLREQAKIPRLSLFYL